MFYTGGQQSTAFAVPKDPLKRQSLRGQYILSFLMLDEAARGSGESASVLDIAELLHFRATFTPPPSQSGLCMQMAIKRARLSTSFWDLAVKPSITAYSVPPHLI